MPDHYVTLDSDRGSVAAGGCPIRSGMTPRHHRHRPVAPSPLAPTEGLFSSPLAPTEGLFSSPSAPTEGLSLRGCFANYERKESLIGK